jgi:2-polyprenyl-6-methoxyphenol hydroxylase-like FAD-dependent oxidoreductase
MASIVVCGGSVIGLSTAMMLARDGHEVTVVEADPDGLPSVPVHAWGDWKRPGVAQFRQPHNLFPAFRQVAEAELPGLIERLADAGCVWEDLAANRPPSIENWVTRPEDDALRFVTGRRPVVEAVVAAAAWDQPGVTVRRGVRIAAFLPGPSRGDGVVHVAGVRTDQGEEIRADLVIDAMGRRTDAAGLLAELGAPPPQVESEDCGFAYYTRYYTGPQLPAKFGPPLAPLGSITLLTLAGDNDTWSVTAFVATGDPPLKELRQADRFDAVVRACPLQAHWLDGEPISEVLPMAGILDRYRRFFVDGRPVATGFAAVGDAWACTNPSAGRGLSVGIIHAQLLRDVLRAHPDDPLAFAHAWDAETEEKVSPFYWNQIAADRERIAEMHALRDGADPAAPDPLMTKFGTAMARDADVFRAYVEVLTCLALPQEVFARPGMTEKIEALGSAEPMKLPGPERAQLLDLLAG